MRYEELTDCQNQEVKGTLLGAFMFGVGLTFLLIALDIKFGITPNNIETIYFISGIIVIIISALMISAFRCVRD